MAKLIESTSITLPAPTLGFTTTQPLAAMSQGYSPWLLNVECENQFLKLRNGWVLHCAVGTSSVQILALGSWGVKATGVYKLFAYCSDGSGTHKIYDVTTSTESLDDTLADDTATTAFSFKFSKRLGFGTNADFADCNQVYDGSTWAAWGFTYSGSPIGGQVSISYKGRVYIFSGTNMYYGDLDAITGATEIYSLESILEESGEIVWAALISSPGERAEDVYLAFGTSAGEILVYGGDYPESATWGLVGKFKRSPPLGFGSIISFGNDVLLLEESSIVSLRELFTKGSFLAEQSSISSNIGSYWKDLIRNLNQNYWPNNFGVSGVFWPERNQIVILMPGFLRGDTGEFADETSLLVYNVLSGGWSVHRLQHLTGSDSGNLTYFDGNLYFSNDNNVYTIDLDGYGDYDPDSATIVSYGFDIHGTYVNFGTSTLSKRVVAYQPLIRTDIDGVSIEVQARGNFGVFQSAGSAAELTSGYNQPYYSVGVSGIYSQYRITGSSDPESTEGYELYAVTAILIPEGRG